MTSIDITAAIAGKPKANSKGAPTADGVPKPDEPSISEPKSQATMMTCTRRSGETSMNPWRIALSAPHSLRVFKSKIAPNTINKRVIEVMIPLTVAAATIAPELPQTNKDNRAVTTYAAPIESLADRPKTTISTNTTTIGAKDNKV